jgi:hypothetical protein
LEPFAPESPLHRPGFGPHLIRQRFARLQFKLLLSPGVYVDLAFQLTDRLAFAPISPVVGRRVTPRIIAAARDSARAVRVR